MLLPITMTYFKVRAQQTLKFESSASQLSSYLITFKDCIITKHINYNQIMDNSTLKTDPYSRMVSAKLSD